MRPIKCPCCKAPEMEVSRNAIVGGVTVRCGACGYLDCVTEAS